MPNKRTLGYIVVGGDHQPLRFYTEENRFYIGVWKHDRCNVTIFPRGDYESARRCIGNHYHTQRQPGAVKYTGDLAETFNNLKIVRLTGLF